MMGCRITEYKFLPLVFALLLCGCYNDNMQDMYPVSGNCDTIQVSYTSSIAPIISTNCQGCHSLSAADSYGNGLVLEGHAALSVYITSHPGVLQNTLQQTGPAVPMPPGSPALSNCAMAQLNAWIHAGMPDN